MLTTKVLLNSVISTKGAQFMTIDISDFYLNTPMVHPKYMRLKVSDIPDHIIALYNLNKLATTNGYVCPYPKRYVQSPTSRNHCPATTQKGTSHQRLPSEHHHTRFLETALAPHLIHLMCRRFWSKIHWH
eukprot:CCRYP_007864-RA/>CCRYP_007864-RA protein AED:0.45 eAED:0.45 QI:0/-1/0/1/-1/0/1/0/129